VQDSDGGALVQELSMVETAAEGLVGRGAGWDGEREGSIQYPGLPGGRPVHEDGLGLPQFHGCGAEGSVGQGRDGGTE